MLIHRQAAEPVQPNVTNSWAKAMPVDRPPETAVPDVLDTAKCLRIRRRLVQLEDEIFGPDFSWPIQAMEKWVCSGSLFYAAVQQRATPAKPEEILALVSVLVVERTSCQALMRGEIRESGLRPWLGLQFGPPVLYFASIVSQAPRHVPRLYASLLRDLYLFARAWGNCEMGVSIASSPVGLIHLRNNGFYDDESVKYLGKYPIVKVDAASARTPFWQSLLAARVLNSSSGTDHIHES